jgi:hypothetical protein
MSTQQNLTIRLHAGRQQVVNFRDRSILISEHEDEPRFVISAIHLAGAIKSLLSYTVLKRCTAYTCSTSAELLEILLLTVSVAHDGG